MYLIVVFCFGSFFMIINSGVISVIFNVLSWIYNLNVSVFDGKYFIYVLVKIVVLDIIEDILWYFLILCLLVFSLGIFVERNLGKCRDYLGFLFNVFVENVYIWSL